MKDRPKKTRRALGKKLVMQPKFRSRTEPPKKGRGAYDRRKIKSANDFDDSGE